VAVPLLVAFLLKRAVGWHHVPCEPIRFVHLSVCLQPSESARSHLVEHTRTASASHWKEGDRKVSYRTLGQGDATGDLLEINPTLGEHTSNISGKEVCSSKEEAL
jgi:hypothetical protein